MSVFDGDRVSVWGDVTVLETDGGDECASSVPGQGAHEGQPRSA